MIEVKETFAKLRIASKQAGKFKTMAAAVRPPEGDPSLGVDVHDRLVLLVPSDDSPVTAVWFGKAMSVELGEIDHAGQPRTNLVIRCLSSQMEEEFILLVTEILSTLETQDNDGGRLAAVVLGKWRALFEADPPKVLGIAAIAGLFGELTDLQRLVESLGPAALTNWTGPDRARHDFEFDRDAVETKTTLSMGALRATIHGLRQLEAPPGGDLYLSLHLLEHKVHGVSVPDLIERLLASGVDGVELRTRLGMVGYLEVHRHHYESIRFAPLEHRIYHVHDTFPRITPATLHADIDAIDEVSYTVNLAGLQELPAEADTPVTRAIR